MLKKIQQDFSYYSHEFKDNYRKGVHRLRTILASRAQAQAFVSNAGGVAVVLGYEPDKPDKNAQELYALLMASPYIDDAVQTFLGSIYEAGAESQDAMYSDSARCLEILHDPVMARAAGAGAVSAGKWIAALAGQSCNSYRDITAVAASATAMNAVAASATAMNAVAASATAMNAVAASATAMNAVAASATAMNAVAASATAMNAVAASATAMNAVAASATAMNAVAASATAMNAVAASATAMNAVAANSPAVAAIFRTKTALDIVKSNQSAWATLVACTDGVLTPAVCDLAGIDPTDYADGMTAVAASETAMTAVAASETAMTAVAASETAMTAVAASETAMTAVAASETAMTAVAASETAMTAVAASETAMTAVAASETAMTAVAASETAMTAVAASETAMTAVAASETAMTAVAASETAMTAVAASETAMTAVAASETAMTAVAASETAIKAIAASYNGIAAIYSNATALAKWNAKPSAVSAIAGTSSVAIGKAAVKLAGLAPDNFADMAAVAASSTAMAAVAASDTAMKLVTASAMCLAKFIGSAAAKTALIDHNDMLQKYRAAIWTAVTGGTDYFTSQRGQKDEDGVTNADITNAAYIMFAIPGGYNSGSGVTVCCHGHNGKEAARASGSYSDDNKRYVLLGGGTFTEVNDGMVRTWVYKTK